jgi:hypothetical protein
MLSRPSRTWFIPADLQAAKACSQTAAGSWEGNQLRRGTHAFAAKAAVVGQPVAEGRESMAPLDTRR